MNALDYVTEIVAANGGRIDARGMTCCWAHADSDPSLHISQGEKGVVFHCFAGCEPVNIITGRPFEPQKLFNDYWARMNGHATTPSEPPLAKPNTQARPPSLQERGFTNTALYDYCDENSELLYQVMRWEHPLEPKEFRQRRPDGHDRSIYNLGDSRRVPYRLPELARAVDAGDPVFICEGEKDTDAMHAAGHVATCNSGGAGKWLPEFAAHFKNVDVTIVADKDEPGRKHARAVATTITGIAKSVRIVEAKTGKDAFDHLAAGHSVEEFIEIGPAVSDDSGTDPRAADAELEASLLLAEPSFESREPSDDQRPNQVPVERPAVDGDAAPTSRRMHWQMLDEVAEEKTEWLSHPRIPRGKIVTLDGFEGCGKTFVALKCCADLSRGRPLFGAPHTEYADPSVSIYMTAEDGLGDTIKPRLAAMDADMSKIFVLHGPIENDEQELFSLFDFELIEHAIVETGAVLFVLDPVFAYLEDKDPAKTKDVRPILRKLTEIAARTGCSFLLIRHLKKGFEERANHRSGGCVDWAAVARSMLLLVEDREDREKRVIAHSKSNLAPKGPTLRFEIVGMDVKWRGESPLDADDLLRPRGSQDEEDGAQGAKAEAAEFLRTELAAGPLPQKKLEELAKDARINWSAIKRAKADLKIRSKKLGDGTWTWELPTAKPSWEARDD